MATRPPKAQIQRLIEAYARKIYSGLGSTQARVKDQQRMYDAFERIYDGMRAKFPNIDMTSDAFFSELRSRSDEWWRSRPVKGAGIDW